MCPLLTVPPVLNNCWVTSVCAAVCIAWPALLPDPLHRLTRIASRPLAILCRTATELDRDTHIERRRCEYIHPICGYVGGWEYNRCESRRLGRKHHSSTGLNATSLAGGVARTSKSTALSASELVPYRILSNPLFSDLRLASSWIAKSLTPRYYSDSIEFTSPNDWVLFVATLRPQLIAQPF